MACAPFAVIGPLIAVVCRVGPCTISGKMIDVCLTLAMGVVGYVFKKFDSLRRTACRSA